MYRKEQCWRCESYGDERVKLDGAEWSTCRITSPETGSPPLAGMPLKQNTCVPGRFPWMPRDGWCRRWELRAGTPELYADAIEFGELRLKPKPEN